jgi:hypothetical protein
MKHFTPQRWLALQNVDDERSFYSAHRDWEQATAAYRKELERALPRLPADLRRFAQGECLHDATIIAHWQGRSRLSILLRPDAPDDRLFLLVYTLVEPPRVAFPALPPEYRTGQAGWMYDEIGVEEGGDPDSDPVFTHAVLLRDGREIKLRFRRFTYARPQAGLPAATPPPAETVSALSHSA